MPTDPQADSLEKRRDRWKRRRKQGAAQSRGRNNGFGSVKFNPQPTKSDEGITYHSERHQRLVELGEVHGRSLIQFAGAAEFSSAAWTRKEGKRESGGLNQKGVESYRKENPGSKLKTAVTRDPKKLKKGGKAAKRRASFCARMKGMKKRRTSAKTANDPNSRINKSLRAWNC